MRIIQREQLIVDPNRQRKKISTAHVDLLRESILTVGLLHPPVVLPDLSTDPPTYRLVAGASRVEAIDSITDGFFYCNRQIITPGEVPVLELQDALTPVEIKTAELDENIIRSELPWQDRVEALAEIAKMRGASDDVRAFDRSLMSKNLQFGSGAPIKYEIGIGQRLREAALIAQHLSDPTINKARNVTEALHLVHRKEEKAFEAELLLRQPKQIQEAIVEVRNGNLLDILPKLETGFVDLLLADPPYGIGADAGGFRQRTVHHHNYEDTKEYAKLILQSIISEGFRICRPRANLFLFLDIDLFGWTKEIAQRSGWDVFRTPLTWAKSDSEGLAPWGRSGFRRTCEWLLYATKGEKGLYHSPIDILRFNRVGRSEREYGPEKPIALLKELINASTLENDFVLDPCCGSGSTLVAAKALKRKALGIELDQRAFNIALVNSSKESLDDGTKAPAPDVGDL